jgi:hypothetical protein
VKGVVVRQPFFCVQEIVPVRMFVILFGNRITNPLESVSTGNIVWHVHVLRMFTEREQEELVNTHARQLLSPTPDHKIL